MSKTEIRITLEETATLIREAGAEGIVFSIPSGDLVVDLDAPVSTPMLVLAELRGVNQPKTSTEGRT